MENAPTCYVIGGPNGAGKTSTAIQVLPDLDCLDYVNADALAAALSPFQPQQAAMEAGRLMLQRIHHLAETGRDFAFETTLASRSFHPFLKRCKANGYRVVLLYLYLPSADLAVARVQSRVASGGHHIPEADIRRRYRRSLDNLSQLYIPIVDYWEIYDNTGQAPILTAWGEPGKQAFLSQEFQHVVNP